METCKHCKKQTNIGLKRHKIHEDKCQFNPTNKKVCACCGKDFYPKYNRDNAKTCSYSCSNTFFRTGEDHGNWKEDAYRTTCFLYHKKECVICKEDKIVEVHHLDEDSKNNSPENLIPLCPTHHKYWHSRHRCLIEKQIKKYLVNWKKNKGL